MNCHYLLGMRFGRVIILSAEDKDFAWSGCRWVPISGDTQICNFDDRTQAFAYADRNGLQFAGVAA